MVAKEREFFSFINVLEIDAHYPMAQKQYRTRAAELLAQSKLQQNPDIAAFLEGVAACFRQLADTPTLPIVFEFPRKRMFPRYSF